MFQEKKRFFNLEKILYTLLLMSLTIIVSALTLSQKVYAEEKDDGTSKNAGSDIKITVTGDLSTEPSKAADDKETKDSSAEILPDIEIYIDVPEGYFSDKATVTFRLKTKDGSMPKIKNVKARIGKKGTYQDVTSSMSLEITENCTVHVVATDESGRTYERSRSVQCFDKDKPTLNASVSEGILEVVAEDEKSGVKNIIVNGYEYTDLKNGKLMIRLSQFDGGYEKFIIQATDNAGNRSDSYSVKNPYHKNKDSNSDTDPATELPVTTDPTEIGDATGEVTGHVKTDKNGNIVKETSGDSGNSGDGSSDVTGNNDGGAGIGKDGTGIDIPDNLTDMLGSEIIEAFLGGYSTPTYAYDESLMGREFYTITTESGKVFYLIIDRTSGKEVVRFLTDITEEDLLHVVKNSSQSLPRNSAAKDSGIPIQEVAISNNNTGNDGYSDTKKLTDEEAKDIEKEQQDIPEQEIPEESFIKKNMSYIIMGVAAVIFIIAGYYFKVVKKRREADPDDETGESEEDETGKDSEDDYLGSDDTSQN